MVSSGILLLAGGTVQAQVGSGVGSGGVVGQGSPDMTRPGKSEDAAQRGSGSSKEFNKSKKQGHESSGKMGKDSLGRPSGEPTNPGIGTANGSDSGAGSGSRGDTLNSPGGTSSGTESGGGIGPSSGTGTDN